MSARVDLREGLTLTAIVLVLVVAFPLLAALLFVGRIAALATVLALAAAALVVYAASPRFREWLALQGSGESTYKGLALATDVAVSPAHTWARIEGREASVGIDDLAARALGAVEHVELPRVGRHVGRGTPLFRLSSRRHVLEACAPVSGEVVAVNRSLELDPRMANEAPYGKGWAVRLRGDDLRAEKGGLHRGLEARDWYRTEVDRLLAALGPTEVAVTLPDGGVVAGELAHHIDDAAWQRVSRDFFTPARGGDLAAAAAVPGTER